MREGRRVGLCLALLLHCFLCDCLSAFVLPRDVASRIRARFSFVQGGGHPNQPRALRESPVKYDIDNEAKDLIEECGSNPPSRRCFLSTTAAVLASSWILPERAHAKGLVQFPLAANKPLFNSYTFVRVGTTLLEEEDIWSTNPLFLTNRDDALSPDGQAQIQQACETLVATVKPTTVIYSLAAASMDAANIIQQELQMGRDRIRAEFTFMDPRAIGQYDLLTASTTQPAVWALDADEAGPEGRGGRPPPNEDGTPHETLADQAIRLRQLFSVLESQYSGENIVLVFPDGTGPALLCAMMAGLALNQVHRLEFQPGQVRANVTPALIRQWYAESLEPTADAVYQKRLKLGRQRLAELRGQEEFVNRKDEKLEEERLDYERELAVQQAQVQLEKDKEEEQRQERKAEVEAQRAQVETQRVEARARSAPSVGTGSSPWSISPAVLGGGAFATTLVLSQLRPREDGLERIAQSHARADVTGSTNATSTTTNTTTTLYNNVGSQRAADANATREATATSSPPPPTNTPTTRTTSSLYGAPEDPMSRLLLNTNDEASREMAAAQAMQEYLEQDDGGDDWLISLLQMLEEEEDVAPAEEEEPKDHHDFLAFVDARLDTALGVSPSPAFSPASSVVVVPQRRDVSLVCAFTHKHKKQSKKNNWIPSKNSIRSPNHNSCHNNKVMTSVVFSFLLKVAPRAAKASKPNTQAAVSLWQRFLRGSEEEGEESLEVWLNTLGAGGESPLDPTQPASPQARRELQDFITNMRRLPVSRPFQVETAATRNPSLLRASWPPNAEDLRVPSQWGEPAMVHLPQ